MLVLAVCRPAAGVDPAAAFPAHLAAEREELRNLRNGGRLVQAYSPGGPGAVLLLTVDDLDHAANLLDQLPLRIARLIDIHLTELHPLDLDTGNRSAEPPPTSG